MSPREDVSANLGSAMEPLRLLLPVPIITRSTKSIDIHPKQITGFQINPPLPLPDNLRALSCIVPAPNSYPPPPPEAEGRQFRRQSGRFSGTCRLEAREGPARRGGPRAAAAAAGAGAAGSAVASRGAGPGRQKSLVDRSAPAAA